MYKTIMILLLNLNVDKFTLILYLTNQQASHLTQHFKLLNTICYIIYL